MQQVSGRVKVNSPEALVSLVYPGNRQRPGLCWEGAWFEIVRQKGEGHILQGLVATRQELGLHSKYSGNQ